MKNKLRFMVLTIIVVLCMTAFTVPAFAEAAITRIRRRRNPTLRRLTIRRP